MASNSVLPSAVSGCAGDQVACRPAGEEEEDFWDAYMIVALVCFVLGALLLFAGFIRLIWYFTKPRKRWKLESIQSLATSCTDLSRGVPASASKYSNRGFASPSTPCATASSFTYLHYDTFPTMGGHAV